MTQPEEPLPTFLAEPSKIGQEISVTGKWIPTKQGGLFRKSAESKEMLKELGGDIHADAKGDAGVLSTEINHVLAKTRCLFTTFSWTPTPWFTIFPLQRRRHVGALTKIAKPQLHLIRGVSIPALAREALSA